MFCRFHTRVLVILVCFVNVGVTGADLRSLMTVDLGWLQATELNGEWTVARVTEPISSPNALQPNDIVLAVDDLHVSGLNALSVARILNRINLNATSVTVRRSAATKILRLHASSEPFGQAALMTEANSNPVVLYKVLEPAPDFNLPDKSGELVKISMAGRWTLLHIWNTHCDPSEIAALNEIAGSPEHLSVVGIAMNDTAGTLTQFMDREKIAFLSLVGGPYDGDFARRFNYFALRTDIVVNPEGRVLFVGSGKGALNRAWAIFRENTQDRGHQ